MSAAVEKSGTGIRSTYEQYLDDVARYKAAGEPVTTLTCPHCREDHEVPAIPGKDSMCVCPHCEELMYKFIDDAGQAHAALPGKILDALVAGGAR